MRTICGTILAAGSLVLAASAMAADASAGDAALTERIRKDHPRMFFNADMWLRMKENAKGPARASLDALLKRVDSYPENPVCADFGPVQFHEVKTAGGTHKTTAASPIVNVKEWGSQAAECAHGAFDIRDYGAKGDGETKDTAAIQRAIDAASAAGGGEVLLPKGIYLCGSVFLKNGVDFHIAEGAVLKGSPDKEDYNALDVAPQNWGRLGSGDNISGGHLILCVEQENVTLRGPGKVDGNVGAFLKMPDGSHPPTKLRIPWRPAQMIWFVESRNVTIRDIEIADAPYWSCFIYGCEDVVVERANIHTVRNPHTYNGDGLDIDSSRRVRVTDCNISTADDAITLRAAGQGHLKNDGPCADITVSNCTFSSDCNAIRLGVGNGVIRDCSFTGIRIENTRYAVNAVGAWSRPEHGVDISNISFSDMEIDAKGFCKFYYKHATDSVFDGIAFRQVRGRVREPSIFDDTPKRPFRNLVFEDVKLEGETSPRVAGKRDAERQPREAAASGRTLKQARQIRRDKEQVGDRPHGTRILQGFPRAVLGCGP